MCSSLYIYLSLILTVSDQPLGSFGTMVCQKVSYLDALSLDISGGGEVVDKPLFSDTCDNSNVTVFGISVSSHTHIFNCCFSKSN